MEDVVPHVEELAWYTIRERIHDRDLAQIVCSAVLDLIRPVAARASLDAYTDHRKLMPPEVDAAEATLHERGRGQHRGDPGMGVILDPHDDGDWSLLALYASWSINVEVYDLSGDLVANLHDCGHEFTARLMREQVSDLTERLNGLLTVEAYDRQ